MSEPPPQDASTARLHEALALHQAGRLEDAAAVYTQLLSVQPDHAMVLNLLGNVEHQRGRVWEAVRLIERAIRIDPDSPVHRVALGHVHRRRGDLPGAIECYRQACQVSRESVLAAGSLAQALQEHGDLEAAATVLEDLTALSPAQPTWLRQWADVLVALGQPARATQAYRRALALDPQSSALHFALGVALSQCADEVGAASGFDTALALDPACAPASYNLGVLAAKRQQLDTARGWFERTLSVAPDHVDARINLSAVLLQMGQVALAHRHRDQAYRQQCLFVRPSRTAQRSVLVLFDAGKGNLNLTHLFSAQHNTVIDWMIEYAPPGQAESLPAHALVFNAMGDPDMTGAAAAPAAAFLARSRLPVLNLPQRVARTSRDKIPALLDGIDGLCVPAVWRIDVGQRWPDELRRHLPLLVRPVDTHGGGGLRRVEDAPTLQEVERTQTQPLYVASYVDFAGTDGYYRKYRVIYIDRQPYPYHLAISPHWLVHYATADMPGHGWKLAQERAFLEDPQRTLGPRAWAAVQAIGQRMDLDYAGVDFSLLADGRVLVFEANPVMLVHPEDPHGALAHKNTHVQRILDAFEALLHRTAGGARTASWPPAP